MSPDDQNPRYDALPGHGADHHSLGHGHSHGHGLFGGHSHAHPTKIEPDERPRVALRILVAGLILVAAMAAACAVMVTAGQAIVIAQFGAPVRVVTEPGLTWKWPAPAQSAIPVDLRLHTSSTGLQDVGTRDGLRILAQAYVVWRVAPDEGDVLRFVRAGQNDPDEVARQLRSFVGSALQVTASGFDLQDLVNTDASRLRLADFEARLTAQLRPQLRQTFGIEISSVGLERLSLPEATLAATVDRIRSERETVAAERTADGLRAAAEIRSNASRDGRILVAEARAKAAQIEADSRRQAAEIQAKAYAADPSLYEMIRSLDALGQIVNANTRIVLRTDSAPFDVLVSGPPKTDAPHPPAKP